MHWNAIYFCLYAKSIFERILESEIMDRVAAVEQGAVNIKKIGVSGIPFKAGADVDIFVEQRWHPD